MQGAPLDTISCPSLSLFRLIGAVLGSIHFSMAFFTDQEPVPHLIEPFRKNTAGSYPDNAKSYARLNVDFVEVAPCNARGEGRSDAISLDDLANTCERLKAVLDAPISSAEAGHFCIGSSTSVADEAHIIVYCGDSVSDVDSS